MRRTTGTDVVVITGASAGVGRATARAFAQRGCRIGLLARGVDRLKATQRDVEGLGGQALAFPTDVANAVQVEAAADAVEEAFGPIDIWINNAMTSVFSPFSQMTLAEFQRVTEVAYLGVVYGTRAALRRMLPRDQGVIVQVGSALAYRAIPLQSAYCGAKHAVEGFTESVRCELLHDRSRVRLTMVHLPALNTPQFRWVKSRLPRKAQPVPPIYQPEVAAEAIRWAAYHPRRELNVGASTVLARWAGNLFPNLADRYLARTAFEAQQTDEPEDPHRPHNLWDPAPGLHGAHGDFDDRARGWSRQLWATTHRTWVFIGAAGVGGAVYAALRHMSSLHAERMINARAAENGNGARSDRGERD